MNKESLLSIRKHTNTLIQQTKTKPQETLEFKMNKQMATFSFNPPTILVKGGKWLLAKTSFECTNSVFNKTNENNSFLITKPGHWQTESAEKPIDELNKLLGHRTQDGIELHVKEIGRSGNQIKIGDNEYKLSDFDT